MEESPNLTSVIDKLVALELYLVSAYESLLKGIPKGSLRLNLKNILRSHRQAAQLLSGRVDGELGTRPDRTKFPIPDQAAEQVPIVDLRAIAEQERSAIGHYEAALKGSRLNPGLRSLIETAILPDLRERVSKLSAL
jgi:hypothetical protein